jgi:hypothetical protein
MTAPAEFQSEIPIVLTATIVPNQIAAASDPETRMAEYLKTVTFYQQYAPVIFLENSPYPLERHPEFQTTSRLQVKRFAPSANPERGKGYQEFEMLDAWLAAEPQPPQRWLKITGRYLVVNVRDILAECAAEQTHALVIDRASRSRMARTYLFGTTSEFYGRVIAGLYRECDDRTGDWIERRLFAKLKRVTTEEARFFKTQPRLQARAGTDGSVFPTGRGQWLFKQGLRRLNRLVDQQQLWYSR